MKTRVALMSLVVLLISMFSVLSLSADPGVGLISDGELVLWDEDEFGSIQIRDSRTLIPLRIVSESLGLKVSWDNDKREALVRHNGQLYRFPIDKNVIISETKNITTDVANTIIANRTYLPLRAFFELVGYEVDWQSGKKIDVQTKAGEAMNLDSYVIVKTPVKTVDEINLLSRARSTEELELTTDDLDSLYHVNHLERVAVEISAKPEPAQPTPQNSASEDGARARISALYSQYPEGLYWDGSYCYVWLGNHAYYGYDGCGCSGFALEFSDQIFGKDAPAAMYTDFSNIENSIRVGDIISVDYGGHQVVVTEVLSYGVEVVEGNYAGMVHWGRVYSFDELREVATFYFTRY